MSDLNNLIRDGVSTDPTIDKPAGLELIQNLLPAGGLPVFPPSVEGRTEIHSRHIDGQSVQVVELDSVGSSANRIEECLRALYDAGEYPLPVSSTTIKVGDGDVVITTLDGPHRVFDAWLRYSAVEGSDQDFEASELGIELAHCHLGALDTLLEVSAHDLLLGTWDSHRKGPHGQVRIARALTSTLIGLDPIEQASFAARRDPLNFGEGSEKAFRGKKLSEAGLSSIPPQKNIPYEEDDNGTPRKYGASRVEFRGGVSISSARFQAFLSFPSLRRLGFQRYEPIEVRTALAWLGIYGLLLRCAQGWDLRSRCVLTADGPAKLRLVGADGAKTDFDVDVETARANFESAVTALKINDRSVKLVGGKDLGDAVAKLSKADG